MGVNANAIEALKGVLAAGQTTGQSLEYLTNLYIGDRDVVTTRTRPYMWIRFGEPETKENRVPALEESWTGAKDRKDATLRIQVEVSILASNSSYPYGVTADTGKRGFIVATEDVMNRIEANRSSLVAPATGLTKVVDFALQATVEKNPDDSKWVGVVTVAFRLRFAAADR